MQVKSSMSTTDSPDGSIFKPLQSTMTNAKCQHRVQSESSGCKPSVLSTARLPPSHINVQSWSETKRHLKLGLFVVCFHP